MTRVILIICYFCFIVLESLAADVLGLCHSSCGTCKFLAGKSDECSSCSSNLSLAYSTFKDGQTTGPCNVTSYNNAQLLMTIDKDTIVGQSYLKSFTYDFITQPIEGSISQQDWKDSVFTGNMIQFINFPNTNKIIFSIDLDGLIHEKILVRTRALTSCIQQVDRTFMMVLQTAEAMQIHEKTLDSNIQTLIETQILSNSSGLELTLEFLNLQEKCSKLIQDIVIYYEKCMQFCQSNDCPSTKPYFKHPKLPYCVSVCPDGYKQSENHCVLIELCHSTCDKCEMKTDYTSCTACSSSLQDLKYDHFESNDTSVCALVPKNTAQYLMTIDKNTQLGQSYLTSVTYNESIVESTVSTPLSDFLFHDKVIEFMSLSSNRVEFLFSNLPTHKKLLIRARVYTLCNQSANSSSSFSTLIEGSALTPNTEAIIEGEIVDDADSFNLVIEFGEKGEVCRKILQDVSVYYERCEVYCGSSVCPEVGPYVKHPYQVGCVSGCPDGYQSDFITHGCSLKSMCHSTCDACSTKNNESTCESCSSALSSLNLSYTPSSSPLSPRPCSLSPTSNISLLFTISNQTQLKQSYLQNVTYGGNLTQSTASKKLAEFLYDGELIMIDVDSKVGSYGDVMGFGMKEIPAHEKLIVRARVMTQCVAVDGNGVNSNTEDSSGKQSPIIATLTLVNGSSSSISTTQRLLSFTQTLIECETVHTSSTFSFSLSFSFQLSSLQTCPTFIQDISIYYEKCSSHCLVECPQNSTSCETDFTIDFVFVLDFVYQQFDYQMEEQFGQQVVGAAVYPESVTEEEKMKFFSIKQVKKGSVYLSGTISLLSQQLLNSTFLNFQQSFTQGRYINNMLIESALFTKMSASPSGNNITNTTNPSSEQQQASSPGIILIVVAIVGGVLGVVVVGVVVYCCWWKKRKGRYEEEGNEEGGKDVFTGSQDILKSYGQRSSRGYFGDNIDFDEGPQQFRR